MCWLAITLNSRKFSFFSQTIEKCENLNKMRNLFKKFYFRKIDGSRLEFYRTLGSRKKSFQRPEIYDRNKSRYIKALLYYCYSQFNALNLTLFHK